jgi:hypothetical protein
MGAREGDKEGGNSKRAGSKAAGRKAAASKLSMRQDARKKRKKLPGGDPFEDSDFNEDGEYDLHEPQHDDMCVGMEESMSEPSDDSDDGDYRSQPRRASKEAKRAAEKAVENATEMAAEKAAEKAAKKAAKKAKKVAKKPAAEENSEEVNREEVEVVEVNDEDESGEDGVAETSIEIIKAARLLVGSRVVIRAQGWKLGEVFVVSMIKREDMKGHLEDTHVLVKTLAPTRNGDNRKWKFTNGQTFMVSLDGKELFDCMNTARDYYDEVGSLYIDGQVLYAKLNFVIWPMAV